MISPIASQQISNRITIPANQQYPVPFVGSFVAILSNNGSIDCLVSMDNGTTTKLRAGSGLPCVKWNEDQTSLIPAIFKRVIFENTLSVPITIEYLISLGTSTIPVVINDTVRVESQGVPVARASIAAVVGGIAVPISADAKAINIQPTGVGVVVEVGGNRIATIGEGDFMTFPWSNITLTLKGDGATSTVYVTEVQ